MANDTINEEDLLPDYYIALSVDYHARPDTIKEAFMVLTNDADTFSKYKDMVGSFLDFFYIAPQLLIFGTDSQICDAYMCLASTGDRAAYDAFYFHTTCWYSKTLWLTYRNERRRLDWDDAAKKNTGYLAEIQQAVVEAFEAALAADPLAGHAAEKKAAMALSRKTHRCRGYKQRKKDRDEGILPDERERERTEQEKKEHENSDKEREREKESEKERERALQQKGGTDSNSDSGQSEFTLIQAVQASSGEGASQTVNNSPVAAGAAVPREEPRADVNPYKLTAPGTAVTPTRPTSASEAEPTNATLHRKTIPKVSAVASGDAGSAANRATCRPAAVRPAHLKAAPTRPASLSAAKAATAATRPGYAAHTKTPAAPEASTRLADKTAISTTARPTRVTRSTATAMTASAASKARPIQRPAVATGKQPHPTGPLRRPASTTTSATVKVSPPRLARAPPPQRIAPPVQKKPQAATASSAVDRQNSTPYRVAVAPIAKTDADAPDKSSNASTIPAKRGMLANSRWAQPQTCANGRPGHPQILGNWKRLPRPGKCTACGCASPGKPTTASIRYLYWCGMCDASFCNECYISKVLRCQQR